MRRWPRACPPIARRACAAWPARLTRLAGIGDLGLRAFKACGASVAARRARTVRRRVHHHLSGVHRAARAAAQTPVRCAVRARLSGSMGRRMGAQRRTGEERCARFAQPRQPPGGVGARTDRAARGGRRDGRVARDDRARTAAQSEGGAARRRRAADRLGSARLRAAAAAHRSRGSARPCTCRAVGTLPPTMHETLDTFFAALRTVQEVGRAMPRRIGADFMGTSNQRTPDAASRVLPIAREHAVAQAVTERPARLDYFDALQAFRDADALLLLGSSEAHYTPSRVYAALHSERPVIAVYHADSPVTELLRRFGRPPSVRLVTYSAMRPVGECIDELTAALGDLAACPVYDVGAVDRACSPTCRRPRSPAGSLTCSAVWSPPRAPPHEPHPADDRRDAPDTVQRAVVPPYRAGGDAIDMTVVYASRPTPTQQAVGSGGRSSGIGLFDGYSSRVVRESRPDDRFDSERLAASTSRRSASGARDAADVALIAGWHSASQRGRWRRAARRHSGAYRGDTTSAWGRRRAGSRVAREDARDAGAVLGVLAVGTRARAYCSPTAPPPRAFASPHAVDNESSPRAPRRTSPRPRATRPARGR